MDGFVILQGLLAGLLATGVMVLTEIPAWRRWGIAGVMEWHENQAMAARIIPRPKEQLVTQGLTLHFVHGSLAGAAFVLVLPLLSFGLSAVVVGAGYGIVLWLITLVIHRPTTGMRIREDPFARIALPVSLVGHLAYGASLGLLVGWP